MHPIERLRMVARAEGAGPTMLAREAASALASMADDHAALVTGCRRLVDRHAAYGPVWWLAARMLGAGDAVAEARAAANQLAEDPTPSRLGAELPSDATVTVLGWPEQTAGALRRRGDVEVLVVDVDGDGAALVRRLGAAGVDAVEVDPTGLGMAAWNSGAVLVEAVSAGPDGVLAAAGSLSAAAVAKATGVPVWAVVGVGRVLPARLWSAQLERVDAGGDEPWERDHELVPTELLDVAVGPGGLSDAADIKRRADCAVAPELLRSSAR